MISFIRIALVIVSLYCNRIVTKAEVGTRRGYCYVKSHHAVRGPCKHHGRQRKELQRDENENLAQVDLISFDQTLESNVRWFIACMFKQHNLGTKYLPNVILSLVYNEA